MTAFVSAFLCITINLLPYRLLAYYPLRRQLKFRWQTVAAIILTSQFIQSLLYAWLTMQGRPTRWVEYVFAVMCFCIYFTCIQGDRWKVLFLYIFIMDYTMITRGTAIFIESRLFYQPGMHFSSLRSALLAFLVFAVTVPVMFWFLRKTKDRIFQTDAPGFWRTIWLMPAFSTLIVLMFTGDIAVDSVRQPRFLVARIFLILSMFVVYYILLRSLDQIRESAAALEQAAQQRVLLALLRTQYQQLSRHMDETRRVRHDLRQHLNVIRLCLESENLEALRQYMNQYTSSLSPDLERSWCKNYAVNAIVAYYHNMAQETGADLTVELSLPSVLPVNEADFCALLGNLFENAMDACRGEMAASPLRPFVRLRAKSTDGQIFLVADNTCSREPALQDGKFLSTKHEGFGTGTLSVKMIAEKYGGSADFQWRDGVFYVSVVMYGEEDRKGEIPAG